MKQAVGSELKQHFDDLATEAPTAADTLVADARSRGEHHRRQRAAMGAGAAVVAAALAIGVGVVQPWSHSPEPPPIASPGHDPASAEPSATGAGETHLAGASWRLLRQPSGGREVEQYDTIESLLTAAPLLVRGTVTKVELGPVIDDRQVDQPYRDLLLTITPDRTAGPAAGDASQVVVQLGPFFGAEAEAWAEQMSTGSTSLIGDEAVWALRPREDAPTYRPLTGDSVVVRDGDGLLTPLSTDTSISQEVKAMSWSQVLQTAGLGG